MVPTTMIFSSNDQISDAKLLKKLARINILIRLLNVPNFGYMDFLMHHDANKVYDAIVKQLSRAVF